MRTELWKLAKGDTVAWNYDAWRVGDLKGDKILLIGITRRTIRKVPTHTIVETVELR